jgi:hypothetical protein
VGELDWYDDPDEGQLPDSYGAFLAELRRLVRPWPIAPTASLPFDVPYAPGVPILVYLDISDFEVHHSLMSIGVYFDGTELRGDELHNQSYELPDTPTPEAVVAVGSPDELAARAADWFESLLRRPRIRREWWVGNRRVNGKVEEESGRALAGGGRRLTRWTRWRATERVVRVPSMR